MWVDRISVDEDIIEVRGRPPAVDDVLQSAGDDVGE